MYELGRDFESRWGALGNDDVGYRIAGFLRLVDGCNDRAGIHTVGCAGFVQSLDDFIGRRTGTYACGNCLKAVIGYGYLWHGATPGYTGRALASTGGKDCSLIMSNRLVFSKIQGC